MSVERILLVALMILPPALFGCSPIHPPSAPAPPVHRQTVFSHDIFERVLQRFGSASGRIDYAALKKEPRDLNRYYALIAASSPDSHPRLFPSDDHRLAYWINAYNAAAIKIVITFYPIGSVREVKPPAPFFFLPDESGFFVFHKPIIGGRAISLYALENKIVRRRFADPRIHFALNCASLGCPRLPREVFSGDNLDEQLDRETRRFVVEERNVRIDHENRTIYLSQIFHWYEDDFIGWLKQTEPQKRARLTGYITRYLPAEKAATLKKVENSYALQFVPYDWQLNDRS